jgi:hypothetical protein
MRSNQQVESRIEPRVRPEPTQRSNPFAERESARILRLKQVSATVGIGRSSIYRKVQEGRSRHPSSWAPLALQGGFPVKSTSGSTSKSDVAGKV